MHSFTLLASFARISFLGIRVLASKMSLMKPSHREGSFCVQSLWSTLTSVSFPLNNNASAKIGASVRNLETDQILCSFRKQECFMNFPFSSYWNVLINLETAQVLCSFRKQECFMNFPISSYWNVLESSNTHMSSSLMYSYLFLFCLYISQIICRST